MLFATGSTLDELAQSTGIPLGTLCSRSGRENWAADRIRVQELASQARAKSQELVASMPERGKRWVSRVAEQADRGMSVIEKASIETLADVTKVTSALDLVDKVARRSYGLDQDTGANRTIVNLGFLQDYAPPLIAHEVGSEPGDTLSIASE
jgi:hypothetical protein